MKRLLGVLMLLAVGGANALDNSNLVFVEQTLVGLQGYDWLLQNNFTDKVTLLTQAAPHVVDAASDVVDAALADVNLVSLEKKLFTAGNEYDWLLETSLQDKLKAEEIIKESEDFIGLEGFFNEEFEYEETAGRIDRIKTEYATERSQAEAAAEAALEEELDNLISNFKSDKFLEELTKAQSQGANLKGSQLFYILTHLPKKFKQGGRAIREYEKTDVQNINNFIEKFVNLLKKAAFIENEDLVNKLYQKLLPSRTVPARFGQGSIEQEVSFMDSMKQFYRGNVQAETETEQLINLGNYYKELIRTPYGNTLLD